MGRDIAHALLELERICREQGLPLTNQRRSVLEVVLERGDHPTPDQVYQAVKGRSPQISRKTVYRVLDTLADLRLIRRVHHPGATTRFDGKVSRHHHLVCSQCNCVIDLHNASLDSIPVPRGRPEGFEIHDFSVHFMGLCAVCRKSKK